MISGEDESSSVLNGRLRPRKSTANIPNPPNKSTHKTENKVAQDKSKRNSTPSKASPNKQDDLTSKAESSPPAQLCPYCDKKFTTKTSASKHARRIHLSTSKQDNFINCLFCNHSEAAPSEIIRHMVDSHPNQYFACLDCNTRFFSTSELAEHKLNVCEKQKQAYRSKLRQKTSSVSKKDQKKIKAEDTQHSRENKELKREPEFNGLVISCELKPSHTHDAIDIEDNITTNLILPSNIGNTGLEKNAVIILDDIQWHRRIPPNFSFRNADADQILSRLGVVHRSPWVGETTRREWLKMIDVTSQKFEKCFDTNFYSRVASNVQQNLARFLDGSFNFSPDPDKVIKTRKSKSSAIINTAEGFPILLPHEQYSRNRFDGYMPRALAPKHKWKWDSTENEKNIIFDASVVKRDNHVDNCIITLVSSLDIWTQLRMRNRFEGIFCKAAIEKFEKQNIIGRELKEILESREIPSSSSQIVEYPHTSSTATPTAALEDCSEFPSFLGLSPRVSLSEGPVQPAVLSGEWVRPRCYVCCACGDQTRDARALSAHMASHHPNAQVQHYEIVGESLLNADILKHLYVPPSQMSNRTRPIRGFRDCTKCKKSVAMEDLHQHMLDCAGDTPTVRRKCRSRPFGVRRRRPRLPDNVIRKKMRKDLRTRHNAKALLRTRPRIRTEVGDAETIRKMIADLPAKRHRQAAGNLNTPLSLRPRRKLDKQRNKLKIKHLTSKDTKSRKIETKNDLEDSSILDEDDQPLKPKTKVELKTIPTKKRVSSRVLASKCKKISVPEKDIPTLNEKQQDASNDTADASHPQQMSSENSTQKLNINSRGNDTREEGNRDGTDNNDNGGERKKSPDRERDKDEDKNIDSDPTPLKHSINSITSSNNTTQLQQKISSPQKANEAETIQDTRNIFLENDISPALPDKPPIQTCLKRSSQKKRESLLNCIEKIKSQQKGETMYDQRQAERLNSRDIEHAQLPLLDPHPAVISRTCDESGAAKNVVPTRLTDPQPDVAGQQFRTNKDMSYPWNAGFETQRQPIDMFMMAPIVEPFYVQKKSEADFNSKKKKSLSGGQRRKSSSTRLIQNEQANQLQMAHMLYQQQWNLNPYLSMVQAQFQQQVDQRISFPDLLQQQHQANEMLKNQCLMSPGQYTSDLHYESKKEQIPMRNETASQSAGNPQNPNTSHSPQSWNRDSLQIQQINNNLAVPRMVPSSAINSFLSPTTTRRSSLKRASESSESDVYCNRNLDDADLLNYAHLRRMSPETVVMPYGPALQRSKESTPYNRSQVPLDITFNKNTNIPDYSHDDHQSKKNRNAYGDSTSNTADYYRPSQSLTADVNNQYYSSRLGDEQLLSKSRSGKDHDGSHTESHDQLAQERYMVRNPYSLMSIPTENRIAEKTSLIKDTTTPKSIDIHIRDNIDILSISQRKMNDHQKQNSYIELADHLETHENQTDSDSLEEPLDLSGKHGSAVCNDNTSKASIDEENDEIPYATLDLSKAASKVSVDVYTKPKSCKQITYNDLIRDNESSLSVKDTTQDKYSKIQHSVQFFDQIPAIDKPALSSDEVLPYYRQINEIKSVSYPNKNDNSYTLKALDSFSKQLSNEKEVQTANYDSVFLTNFENIENSKLGIQASKISASTTSNFCSQNDQLNKMNENYTSALENPRLFIQSEAIYNNMLPSSSSSQQCYNMTERVQTESLTSSENMKQNTSPCENFTTQAHLQRDFKPDETTENIESIAKTTNAQSTSVEKDPETAKKMALFPKELVDLLNVVPKEQHNKFVSVISQLIPPSNEEKNPVVTVEEPPVESQNAEPVKLNIPPIDESAVNTKNRLTINTAILPSSSILPKKRHSPSARLTSQDYSNVLLRPSLVSPSINSVPNDDAKNYESECKEDNSNNTIKKTFDAYEVLSDINKIIDLTDDDHDDPLLIPGIPNSNNAILESVLQTTCKSTNDKPSRLRSVRIKQPMPKQSMSDDKHLMITNSQQSIGFDSKERSVNANVESPYLEVSYKKNALDSADNDNSAYHSNTLINQTDTNITTQDPIQIASELTLNYDQKEQSATSEFDSYVLADKQSDEKEQHLSFVNKKKHQNLVMPDHDIHEIEYTKELKNEASLELARGNNQNILSNVSNSIKEQDTVVVSESSTSVVSEQIHSTIENVEPLYTELTYTYSQDKELLQNNVTGVSSEPNVNNANIVEEESDDDISLAVIVKQKTQDNTFSGNEDSASDSDTSDFPIPTKKEKLKVRSKKVLKRVLSKDSQSMKMHRNINRVLNKSDHEKDLESENHEAEIDNINDANVDDHKTCGYVNKNKNCESDVLQSTFGDDLLANTETAPVSNKSQNTGKGNECLSSQPSFNKNVDAVDPHQFLSKKSSGDKIERNESLICDNSNSMDESNVITTELQPLQQAKTVSCAKISVPSEIIETDLISDSNIPVEVTETTERALRRSRRGKSLFLNDQNQVNSKKIPVAKKQLILSKLRLDENTPVRDSKSELTTGTKIKAAKRKMSPAKTKSKKKKSNSLSDCGFSEINVGYPDETISKPTGKELSNTSENHSSDSGSLGFERRLDFDVNDSNSNTEKQKSVSFDIDDRSNINKTKNNENVSMMDLNINLSNTDSVKTSGSSQVKLNEKNIVDYQIATSAYTNIKKQPEKTGAEIRTACYNRPIPRQQISLTSVFDKNPLNYDPYDIDLDIDMVDMSRPIVKRKTNKSASGKKTKKSVDYENSTDNIQQKIETEMPKIALPDSSPPSVSDSDSSISDVPLQKYVEEKAKLKIESQSKTACHNRPENNNGPNYSPIEEPTDLSELTCQSARQNNNEKSDDFGESELKLKENILALPNTISDADKTLCAASRDEDNDLIYRDYNHGVNQIEPSTEQSNTIKKRNRRPTVLQKSPNVTNEYNQQQLLSDISMNNLELFTYKTPRKSNLIASKKISETFNKLESEEVYYRPHFKNRQKKSSHSEKRSTAKEHTSKTQDTIENTNRKSSPVQSTEPQDTENSSALDEPRLSNDGEVDLITAQKMLDSEEIRKLERDLYSGFKKAAEANAGKTSGFNQLRVEETNQSQSSYDQYVSTPIENDVRIEPINSPERLESPERFESPERSNSPESLKDKPLMYPEEEVNIYEDKYDIIKRRREANANAKQFQKVNKPTQCKSGRVKKKPEKKTIKKSYQKKMQQASQVPTKAALKNFESIKISIPTQDLHMPPNVSPPHRQRRSKSIKFKQSSGKTSNDSVASYKSESDTNSKAIVSPDIYEFQDDERPVLKGYKETRVIDNYRSSSSDNEETNIKINLLPKERQNKKLNNVAIRAINAQQTEKTKRKKGRGKRKGKTPCARRTLNRRQKTEGSNEKKNIPGELQFRFVPDNNEGSSYESDALPLSPVDLAVEDVLECTCPTEKDSGDHEKETEDLEKDCQNHEKTTKDLEKKSEGRETLKGCNSIHCRYKNDNMKNTALENIFRSSCKPEDKENKLNRLFDSLLDGINKTNTTLTPKSDSLDPDSNTNTKSTNFLTTDVNIPLEALQTKYLREKSCVDDGFSSPDDRDSENENKNVFEKDSQISANKINLLNVDDDSHNNIDEISNGAIENLYALVTPKHPKNSVQPSLKAEYSYDPTEMEVLEEPSSHTIDNNNEKIENCLTNLANLDKGLKSGNNMRLKYKRGENEGRSKPTKRLAPLSDNETSASEDESSPSKMSIKNRGKNTIHKSHHKNNKAIRESGGSDERLNNSKATTKTKRSRTSRKTAKGNDSEAAEKKLNEKLSPSRKSDEGISTSHDNSADAYDIALDTGVALQRARRKCTVGKQNVLVEHWSSSESEDEPSRSKGKKSAAAKKSSRVVRKVSSSRRSREDAVEEDNSRALVLRSRDLSIPDRDPVPDPDRELDPVSDESDAERDPKDKSEQELHGWIVGRSHKKLVTMLVCSKRKSSPDDDDDDDEKLKAIEEAKVEEIDEEKEKEKDMKVQEEKEEKEKKERKEEEVKEEEQDEEKEEENEEQEDEENDENMEVEEDDDFED